MTEWLQRPAWHARPPSAAAVPLQRRHVAGVVLHWPGMDEPIAPDRVGSSILGWQSYHMDQKDWNDIGYNLIVDQAGRIWCGRGVRARGAANGNRELNQTYLAVCLVVAADEPCSRSLIASTLTALAYIRRVWPSARTLTGHGDVRPGGTECPGPYVRNALLARRLV